MSDLEDHPVGADKSVQRVPHHHRSPHPAGPLPPGGRPQPPRPLRVEGGQLPGKLSPGMTPNLVGDADTDRGVTREQHCTGEIKNQTCMF